MGTPAFGLMPGNNATPPPFFAGNNPTGGAGGVGGNKGMNSNFPNFPLFGNPSTSGAVSPMANAPLFGNTGMQGLNSGLTKGGPLGGAFDKQLDSAYGTGTGELIYHLLSSGLFNPQTASAFLNAMQPSVNRGEANIMNSFGAEGSRFSSTAALGEGDYLSQVNLNEQQTLASMFMQAQQEELGLLQNTMPTLHAEQANKGSWIDDVLGGLEIAGGIVGAPFTGGLSLGLVGAGVGTLEKGIGGSANSGGSGGGNPLAGFGGMGGMTQMSTPPFMPSGIATAPQNFWQQYFTGRTSASGADALTNKAYDDPTYW